MGVCPLDFPPGSMYLEERDGTRWRVLFSKAYFASHESEMRAQLVDLNGRERKSRGEIRSASHPGVTQRWFGALVPVWGGINRVIPSGPNMGVPHAYLGPRPGATRRLGMIPGPQRDLECPRGTRTLSPWPRVA